MPKIETIILRCIDPAAQQKFYVDVLGMTAFDDGSVGYDDPNAHLKFIKSEKPYVGSPQDLYWKIAIALPNIELACKQLRAKGVDIGTPTQFQDIGYLAHFTDPEGFTVELIEHAFEGQRTEIVIDTKRLGGGPHLNLLTLRTDNIHASKMACEDLGMTPLAIQRVQPDRFLLYFYGFTDDTPPAADLTAVENRPWLYQRPYTVLEIQNYLTPTAILPPNVKQAGYGGMAISGLHETDEDQIIIAM